MSGSLLPVDVLSIVISHLWPKVMTNYKAEIRKILQCCFVSSSFRRAVLSFTVWNHPYSPVWRFVAKTGATDAVFSSCSRFLSFPVKRQFNFNDVVSLFCKPSDRVVHSIYEGLPPSLVYTPNVVVREVFSDLLLVCKYGRKGYELYHIANQRTILTIRIDCSSHFLCFNRDGSRVFLILTTYRGKEMTFFHSPTSDLKSFTKSKFVLRAPQEERSVILPTISILFAEDGDVWIVQSRAKYLLEIMKVDLVNGATKPKQSEKYKVSGFLQHVNIVGDLFYVFTASERPHMEFGLHVIHFDGGVLESFVGRLTITKYCDHVFYTAQKRILKSSASPRFFCHFNDSYVLSWEDGEWKPRTCTFEDEEENFVPQQEMFLQPQRNRRNRNIGPITFESNENVVFLKQPNPLFYAPEIKPLPSLPLPSLLQMITKSYTLSGALASDTRFQRLYLLWFRCLIFLVLSPVALISPLLLVLSVILAGQTFFNPVFGIWFLAFVSQYLPVSLHGGSFVQIALVLWLGVLSTIFSRFHMSSWHESFRVEKYAESLCRQCSVLVLFWDVGLKEFEHVVAQSLYRTLIVAIFGLFLSSPKDSTSTNLPFLIFCYLSFLAAVFVYGLGTILIGIAYVISRFLVDVSSISSFLQATQLLMLHVWVSIVPRRVVPLLFYVVHGWCISKSYSVLKHGIDNVYLVVSVLAMLLYGMYKLQGFVRSIWDVSFLDLGLSFADIIEITSHSLQIITLVI